MNYSKFSINSMASDKIQYADAKVLKGLKEFYDTRIITDEILESIVKELDKRPITLPEGFSYQEKTIKGKKIVYLHICISCQKLYELVPGMDSFLLNKKQANIPGPYCGPCANETLTQKLLRERKSWKL